MAMFGYLPIVIPATVAMAAVMTVGAAGEGATAPTMHTVVIDKMKFGAAPTNVRVGDTILWVNKDMFRHTATARDRSFSIDLAPAKSGKTVVKRAGVIPFYCVFHPGMKGQVTVAEK